MAQHNLYLVASEADTLIGGSGNDSLIGSPFDDMLRGHAGDDTLRGGAGSDILHAGEGSDRLYGDAGNDVIFADDGQNFLFGGEGADIIYITGGTNYVASGFGEDHIYVATGGLSIASGTQSADDRIIATDPAMLDLYAVTDQLGLIWIGGYGQSPSYAAPGRFDSGGEGLLLSDRDNAPMIQDYAGHRYSVDDLLERVPDPTPYSLSDHRDSGTSIQSTLPSQSSEPGTVGQDPADTAALLGSDWNDTLVGNDDGNLLHGEAGNDLLLGGPDIAVDQIALVLSLTDHPWLATELGVPIQEEPAFPEHHTFDLDPIILDTDGLTVLIA